jgi:hypothetical protein
MTHWEGFFEPQPIERLACLRVGVPLAILGFLAARLLHVDHLLTSVGFQVPDLGHPDHRQPLYLAPLPVWAAWMLAAATVVTGLAMAAGLLMRVSGGLFAACLAYIALADRLSAFTVSKLGPILVLALWLTPANARFSLDSWWARRSQSEPACPTHVSWGNVRFFQVLLAAFYSAAGIAKLRGDWLGERAVIWTHLHGSYQTPVAFLLANTLPAAAWMTFQWATLGLEVGAPLWFAWAPSRKLALCAALFMHLFIGLCFSPLLWFSLLMSVLLVACFAPLPILRFALRSGVG